MKEEKAESQPSSIGAIGINGISDPGLKGIRLDIPKQETLEKTAVEWLKMQLEIRSGIKEITVDSKTFEELCEQAKELEKKQIIDAFDSGLYDGGENVSNYNLAAEEYYNKTFKSE